VINFIFHVSFSLFLVPFDFNDHLKLLPIDFPTDVCVDAMLLSLDFFVVAHSSHLGRRFVTLPNANPPDENLIAAAQA
jgi:hypothetical protein